MLLLREHFWTALLLTIVVVSLVIILIFIIINVCISKKAAWYSTEARPNHYDGPRAEKQISQVQHKDFDVEKPPLPSRHQFISIESVDQGYEDLEPASDYVEVEEESNLPVLQQSTFPSHFGFAETKSQNQDAVSEDYDDVEDPVNEDSEDYDDIA